MATRDQVKKKHIPNPTGKGGFQERPQDRNKGTWKSEDSISFQYNKFLRMSQDELGKFVKDNTLTLAQEIALKAAKRAREDIHYLKEITDRTEGKAQQYHDHTTGGDKIIQAPLIISDIKDRSEDE